jgi:hypothetical protein
MFISKLRDEWRIENNDPIDHICQNPILGQKSFKTLGSMISKSCQQILLKECSSEISTFPMAVAVSGADLNLTAGLTRQNLPSQTCRPIKQEKLMFAAVVHSQNRLIKHLSLMFPYFIHFYYTPNPHRHLSLWPLPYYLLWSCRPQLILLTRKKNNYNVIYSNEKLGCWYRTVASCLHLFGSIRESI